MIRTRTLLAGLAALTLSVSAVQAALTNITAFTTVPPWGSPHEGNAQLISWEDYTGEHAAIAVTNVTGQALTPVFGGDVCWGDGALPIPTDKTNAISDDRLDTGSMGSLRPGSRYHVSHTLAGTNKIIAFWNGSTSPTWYDQPTSVSAWDSTGTNQVGSTVSVPAGLGVTELQVGSVNLRRDNNGLLSGRAIFAFSLDVSDFGGTASNIASISLDGSQNTDLHLVGYSTEAPAPDPILNQDTINGDADLEYGRIFLASGAPGETPVRTIRYNNDGPTQDIEISSVSIDNGFVITDVAKNGTGGQSTPLTLAVGDYVEISVKGAPDNTGIGTAFTGSLVVDTDDELQDKILPADAHLYAEGDFLNPNFPMAGGGAWQGASSSVGPGIASGSVTMRRIPGVGDTTNAPGTFLVGAAQQTTEIDDGATAFESIFYFSPVAVSTFTNYWFSPASGASMDRTMQYMIFSDDNVPNPIEDFNFITTTTNIIVNLAYLPDGNTSGGTPGFYVYNGGAFTWNLVIATNLAGSVDADNDGVLDADAGDTVNSYRVLVKGTDFGTGSASYTVTIGSTSSGALTTWHGASGTANTVAGHSFTTGDQSVSTGTSVPFWVDDAALYYIGRPDTNLVVLQGLDDFVANPCSEGGATGTSTLILRNDSVSNSLDITGTTFSEASVSLSNSLPITLNAGEFVNLAVEWDSSASADILLGVQSSIAHNGHDSPLNYTNNASVISPASVHANWDFETPGVGTNDTFALWVEHAGGSEGVQNSAGVHSIPGLLPGSTTAARIDGTYGIHNYFGIEPSDFVAEGVFAVPTTGPANRSFYVRISGTAGVAGIRLINDSWDAFDQDTGWNPLFFSTNVLASVDGDGDGSLDGTNDTKHVYQWRLTGKGWGTGAATYDFEVLTNWTTVIASATNLAYYQTVNDPGPATRIQATAEWGSPDGFWVDDMNVRVDPLPAPSTIAITSISGGAGALTLTYEACGAAVNIDRATSMNTPVSWSTIATGETSGTYTDNTAPAGGAYYRVVAP